MRAGRVIEVWAPPVRCVALDYGGVLDARPDTAAGTGEAVPPGYEGFLTLVFGSAEDRVSGSFPVVVDHGGYLDRVPGLAEVIGGVFLQDITALGRGHEAAGMFWTAGGGRAVRSAATFGAVS
ncbi:hypothetical protein [Actinomadura sp. 3N407]|uniref:hypothetical protein n=1 Tax=Actinomadura sp. 3N407 TaxID=3457423 RepID=UPI003FCE8CF2